MLLPLGDAGIQAVANEQAFLTTVKENFKESGFYFFPAPESRPDMTAEQKRAAMDQAQAKWRTGPAGIMIVHPNGRPATLPAMLLTQFATDVVIMLLAAVLLARAMAKRFGDRVIFVALMGLLPTLGAEIPQWNWYGFPAVFTLAQLVVHLVGFAVGGLVLAKIVQPGLPAKPGFAA
jgi:hypothetical protein